MAEGLAFRPIPVTDINIMMNTVLLPTAYLAPVSYYSALYRADEAYIEIWEHYVKQTIRNRCQIAGPDGTIPLSIPVVKATKPGQPICETRISDHGNWRHRHWNALEAAYRHTPFFLYYEDDFRPFYEQKIESLYDFNIGLTRLICNLIGIDVTLTPTTEYFAAGMSGMEDFRESIHPKQSWQTDTAFCPKEYYQVFKEKHGFIPNMSIADMLFNMGPESILTLHESYSRR